MDYADHVTLHHHLDYDSFMKWVKDNDKRLILLTTKGADPLFDFEFQREDVLLLGRESAGVPQYVHDSAEAGVLVPMSNGMRSLNVAIAGAMVLTEAIRQTRNS